jgi:hypothetical protein
MPEPQEQQRIDQLVVDSAAAFGRQVLGQDPTAEQLGALTTIFRATAQALSEGFIQRLADHVLAERREESIEEFFENQVKAD